MTCNKDLILFFFVFNSLYLLLSSATLYKNFTVETIYQFGDSGSDTGNFIREGLIGASSPIARLPYGETYFKRPTGRCSDGLLMIDFIALALHLPFLNPYLDKGATFNHGVNFAVAGATALDTSFLAAKNISLPVTNSSLFVQLDWFKTHLKSVCYTKTECSQKLKKSLFLVGSIGGNDYNYAFLQGKTIEETQSFVPNVIQTIKDAVRKVIDLGAIRVVVPGRISFGCSPIFLTLFQSNNSASYDENKCLKNFNNFAVFHNACLQRALKQLKQEYPHVDILYADYYSAFKWVLQNAPYLGFEVGSVLKACCGIGGDYNFDVARMCGDQGVPVCPDPGSHLRWDGIHLTQKANKYMVELLLGNIKLVN